jgi:hypothetical protein
MRYRRHGVHRHEALVDQHSQQRQCCLDGKQPPAETTRPVMGVAHFRFGLTGCPRVDACCRSVT